MCAGLVMMLCVHLQGQPSNSLMQDEDIGTSFSVFLSIKIKGELNFPYI
jgi:hypothetical protein